MELDKSGVTPYYLRSSLLGFPVRDKLTIAPRGLTWPPVILAKNCGCEDFSFHPPFT